MVHTNILGYKEKRALLSLIAPEISLKKCTELTGCSPYQWEQARLHAKHFGTGTT